MIETDLQTIKSLIYDLELLNSSSTIIDINNSNNNNKSYFIITYEIENKIHFLNKKYQLNPVIQEELYYCFKKYQLIKQNVLKTIIKKIE